MLILGQNDDCHKHLCTAEHRFFKVVGTKKNMNGLNKTFLFCKEYNE